MRWKGEVLYTLLEVWFWLMGNDKGRGAWNHGQILVS